MIAAGQQARIGLLARRLSESDDGRLMLIEPFPIGNGRASS